MKVRPSVALLSAIVIVIASPIVIFPFASSYGKFAQLICLVAWGAVAKLVTGSYADNHLAVVLLFASILNLVSFLVPASLLWMLLKARRPMFFVVLIGCLCVFQLLILFFLFPVTEGL